MKLTAGLAFVLVAACAHEAPPAPDYPPLPPLARTPVGVLLEHASDLALTDEQQTKLHAIDEKLKDENAPLEDELAELERPPAAPEHGSGEGGGRGGGRRGGRRGGGGGEGGRSGTRVASAHPTRQATQERAAQLHAQIVANDDASLKAAMGLLDDTQRSEAQTILAHQGEGAEAPPELGAPASPPQ